MPRNETRLILAGVLFIFLGVSILVGIQVAKYSQPHCQEDEVIGWSGTSHNKCVPLDAFKIDSPAGYRCWWAWAPSNPEGVERECLRLDENTGG